MVGRKAGWRISVVGRAEKLGGKKKRVGANQRPLMFLKGKWITGSRITSKYVPIDVSLCPLDGKKER